MRTDVMISQLRREAKKHENDKLQTFDTNITAMCTDVANRLEELENEKKEIRAKTIDEFAEVITAKLPKVEKDERVSKMAFVADMIFLVDGIAEKMKAGADNE